MNLFNPERDLARAVIVGAFEDALRTPYARRAGGEITGESVPQAEAISFLTDSHGAWHDSRVSWCEAAGRCPIRVRKEAIRLLNEADPSEAWRKLKRGSR